MAAPIGARVEVLGDMDEHGWGRPDALIEPARRAKLEVVVLNVLRRRAAASSRAGERADLRHRDLEHLDAVALGFERLRVKVPLAPTLTALHFCSHPS